MKLSIDILFEKMGAYDSRCYTMPDSEPRLDCPQLLGKNRSIENKNVLYVAYAHDIPNVYEIEPGCSLVCIGTPNGFSEGNPPKIDLMIVNENMALDMLFNRIVDLFFSFNQWENTMQNLILSNSDLQDFVNESDEIIGWPISIIDRAEKTLAKSHFDDSDDIIWKEICSGYIHTDLLLKDSVKISEIMQYNKPVQRYSTISERILLSQPIRVSGHVVGFAATHHPKPSKQFFSHGVEQLVIYFTGFIAKRMRCVEFYNMSRGSMFEYLLVDLIEGHITDEAVIADRLLFLNWKLEKNKLLIRIEAPQKNLGFLRDDIFQIIPKSHFIIYNGGLVGIISDLGDDGLSDSVFEQLKSFLQKNDAHCGISNVFTSLTESLIYYKQTLTAFKYGKIHNPDHAIYCYSSYTFQHAISILSQHTDITEFYHRAFKKMFPLTKANSILFETLRVYLQTNCNIAASAKILFIHRNSMIYRIKRLEEDLQLDFMDPETRLQLLISYAIYDSTERINSEKIRKSNLIQLNG